MKIGLLAFLIDIFNLRFFLFFFNTLVIFDTFSYR